ncbi:MAG: hypothetical protein E7449_02710 [Ruminococcaceae bacterium]|nr:hypothetical protein [Oscillospiraceae bacterium]
MAESITYREYGAAAVDYFSAAQPSRAPSLPEEKVRPQQKREVRVKAKATVAPLSVLGFGIALVMLILVVFGYVRLYEASSRHASLSRELQELKAENAALSNQYEGQVDLAHVESVAVSELGMQKGLAEQTVYLDLSRASDQGIVFAAPKQDGILRTAYESVRESIAGLLEYLK